MNVLPVIERELRAEARHGFTYWLRVIGAAALLAAGTWVWVRGGFQPDQGGRPFAAMHGTLFFAIWILVPLMTADCISRERREGTLGLLFLTPLTARDIVLAKGFAHGLRAGTLCLAVLPVMTLPLLLGGVSWKEAVLSVLINFSSLCWALAAGLLASSWSRVRLRAVLLATTLAVIFLLFFVTINSLSLLSAAVLFIPGASWTSASEREIVRIAFPWLTDEDQIWREIISSKLATTATALLRATAVTTLFSLLAGLLVIRVAVRNVRRHWQEEPPSARRLWWRDLFCTPVIWQSLLRAWMRRKIERNPIGWLEQRTWTGRMVTWGWLAVMSALLTFAAVQMERYRRDFGDLQNVMTWLMAGSMALTAAGSFRRERESGVLELLLVSPVGVGRIIGGRLRGLWGQFLPAIALLFGISIYLTFGSERAATVQQVVLHGVLFLMLPVIGLYYSLRCRHVISAFLSTLMVGVFMPIVVPWAVAFVLSIATVAYRQRSFPVVTVGSVEFPTLYGLEFLTEHGHYITALIRVLFAAFLLSRLHRSLTRRTFAFQRGGN